MNCPAQSFSGITMTKWENLVAKLQAKTGIEITELVGINDAHGYKIMHNFDPQTGALTIQCLAAPFPENKFPNSINHAIADYVNQS